jgi:capsular polysaccharide biosynthesis protein
VKKELLYPEFSVRRTPPLGYDDPSFHLSFLRLEDHVGPCSLCELDDALVAPSGVVFKDGQIVPESVHIFHSLKPNRGTFYKKMILGRVRPVHARCFVVHNPYHLNYYHWMTEVMPRLFSIREWIRDRVMLMGDESRVWQMEYLRYFDFAGVVHVGRLELARADNVIVPQPLSPFPIHNEAAVREMANWLKDRAGSEDDRYRDFRNLFIVRELGKWRNLINQDEVRSLLERYDFKAVSLESLSVSDQIALFRNVRNLVSVHGAGMANMIYMEPGGSVVDLINEHHRDASFYNLADVCGHRQVVLQCATEGSIHRKAAIYDMSADLEKLRHYLELCMVLP